MKVLIAGAIFGLFIGLCGFYPFTHWQYWLLMSGGIILYFAGLSTKE